MIINCKEPETRSIYLELPKETYYQLVGLAANENMDVDEFVAEFVINAHRNAMKFKERVGGEIPRPSVL